MAIRPAADVSQVYSQALRSYNRSDDESGPINLGVEGDPTDVAPRNLVYPDSCCHQGEEQRQLQCYRQREYNLALDQA